MTEFQKTFADIADILKRRGWDEKLPTEPPRDLAEFSNSEPSFEFWEQIAEAWRKGELGELETETERALWDIVKIMERAAFR